MKICGNCGSTMEPDQIFCDKCGNRYVEPPPPPPQQQPSPQPPNIKKRKKRGWLIPLILLAVVACVVAGRLIYYYISWLNAAHTSTYIKEPGNVAPNVAAKATYIRTDPDIVVFDHIGGTITISVYSDGSTYRLESLPTWCSVENFSGSFELTCGPNSGMSDRSGSFRVSSDDKSVSVSVSQAAQPSKPFSITHVEFINSDKDNNTIGSYSTEFQASQLKFLKPRITYDNMNSASGSKDLYLKIIKPDGSLMNDPNSPGGYTYKYSLNVRSGTSGEKASLTGYGNNDGRAYTGGIYTFEIWNEGNKLYSAKFNVESSRATLTTVKSAGAVYPVAGYQTRVMIAGQLLPEVPDGYGGSYDQIRGLPMGMQPYQVWGNVYYVDGSFDPVNVSGYVDVGQNSTFYVKINPFSKMLWLDASP